MATGRNSVCSEALLRVSNGKSTQHDLISKMGIADLQSKVMEQQDCMETLEAELEDIEKEENEYLQKARQRLASLQATFEGVKEDAEDRVDDLKENQYASAEHDLKHLSALLEDRVHSAKKDLKMRKRDIDLWRRDEAIFSASSSWKIFLVTKLLHWGVKGIATLVSLVRFIFCMDYCCPTVRRQQLMPQTPSEGNLKRFNSLCTCAQLFDAPRTHRFTI